MNESQYRAAKVVIAALLLIVLYLFALNGRYEVLNKYPVYRLDKWNNEIIKSEMP